MSGNVGLNLYDADKFKARGEQILRECKKTIDNVVAPKQTQNIPLIQEKEDNENTGLDIVEISKEGNSAKSLTETTNTAGNIYDDIKGVRAGLSGQYDSGTDSTEEDPRLEEIEDAVKYLAEQEDDNTNIEMMNLHKNNQSKYGDKYFHGNATTDNYYQHEFTTDITGFSSNNNVTIIAGRKKSATLINTALEISEITEDSGIDIDEYINENNTKNSADNNITRTTVTRTEDSEDYPDPEDPPTPEPPKEMTNNKSLDISVLHNRNINIGEKEYIIGAGAEYHNHDNGDNTQLSFRGGFADAASGFGLTFTTTNFGKVDNDGKKHYIRDTKVKAIILNNTIDEYPQKEAKEAGEQNISDLPIVKTENKIGFELNTENENLGGTLSYIIKDHSSFENDTYKRSQAYIKAGYLNEPQGADTPDKHKVKLNATYNYRKVKSNGDYFNANANATYHNTMQSGSQTEYLAGISAGINAKKGSSQMSFQGSGVKTRNTKFLTLTAEYNYSKGNWNFGVNAGYYKMNLLGTPMDYVSAGMNAAYNF